MKRNSLRLSLVLATTVVVAHPSMGISQRGTSQAQRGTAAQAARGAAQTARQNAEAKSLANEGVEFLYDGNFVEAEKKFREALTKYPKAEGSDRTAYYLIDTLVKLRRVQDARTEAEHFRNNYPQSRWLQDVD